MEPIAMPDEDFDPIKIKMSEALDRRFAKFDFAYDNSPRSQDGSVAVSCYVAFGERRQKGQKDRVYTIGIKFAFLDIMEVECLFQPNMELQEQLQKGMLKELTTSTSRRDHDVSLGGTASANADLHLRTPKSAVGIKAGGAYKSANNIDERREIQHERYRVRWVAGGCEFGERRQSVPYDPARVLRGYFLNGNWGRLVPSRGVPKYGAAITLVLPKGMLSVTPESESLTDLIPKAKQRQEDDAFNALKSAVAGWVLESELSSHPHPAGYNRDREELVLAHGQVVVDLSGVKLVAATSENPMLPPQAVAPALPAPEQSEAPLTKKGTRRLRKVSPGTSKT
jgi:hypothetical protein